MSNGSSSCPPVTLPFGVFPATPTICPLEPGDFPGPDPPPCLEDFIGANSPTDATELDGFDQYFADTAAVVDTLEAALGSLEGDLASSFTEADTIDPKPVADTAAGFTASLDPSSQAVNDLGTLLGTVSPPSPGGGAGGTIAKRYNAYVELHFHVLQPTRTDYTLVFCFQAGVT